MNTFEEMLEELERNPPRLPQNVGIAIVRLVDQTMRAWEEEDMKELGFNHSQRMNVKAFQRERTKQLMREARENEQKNGGIQKNTAI